MSNDKWLSLSSQDITYHRNQFDISYRSTLAFCEYLERKGHMQAKSLRILDLASGAGANIYQMSKRYPSCTFVGIELNPKLVDLGNSIFYERGVTNCRLEVGDIYQLSSDLVSSFDGVISYQSLMCFPECITPLQSMARMEARWLAFTSLFYDGPLSCDIVISDYDELLNVKRSFHYNVYSLPVVEKALKNFGYAEFDYSRFDIDIDLPRPTSKGRGTFTEKLADGSRLQFSGPLFMPWYFVSATRLDA